jgi:hypothetical protein
MVLSWLSVVELLTSLSPINVSDRQGVSEADIANLPVTWRKADRSGNVSVLHETFASHSKKKKSKSLNSCQLLSLYMLVCFCVLNDAVSSSDHIALSDD